MMEARTTIKGQIVIPVALRRKFNIKAGTRLAIYEENGRIILEPVTREYIKRLRGSLKGSGAMQVLIDERKRDRERENGRTQARIR